MRGKILLAVGLAVLLGAAAGYAIRATTSTGPTASAARPVVIGELLLNGHGVAGAQLTLYAWPTPAVTSSLRPGQRVPTVVVGTAVSGSSGGYSISLGNWAGLRRAASNGIVNLSVMATDGCHIWEPFSFPRKIVQTATGPALGTALTDNETPQLTPLHAHLKVSPGGKCAGAG